MLVLDDTYDSKKSINEKKLELLSKKTLIVSG